MFEFQPDFPDAARAQLQRAAEAAEKTLTAAAADGATRSIRREKESKVPGGGTLSVTVPSRWDSAVDWYAVTMIAKIVVVSCGVARQLAWSRAKLEATLASLFDQFIRATYTQKHVSVAGADSLSLEVFSDRCSLVMRNHACWDTYRRTLRNLSGATMPPPPDAAGQESATASDPLLTKEGRQDAVRKKLAAVSDKLELHPPLTHGTDFWKTTDYQDRATYKDWIEKGPLTAAHDTFCWSLKLSAAEFHARRNGWDARRLAARARRKKQST
jgi:hypothetical protein